MIKKLEKAVKDLEQRTGSRLAINDYDCDDCGGMQRMTFPGAKYALLCYATSYIDESGNKRIMGCNGGMVLDHFSTQAEAAEMISSGKYDERLTISN